MWLVRVGKESSMGIQDKEQASLGSPLGQGEIFFQVLVFECFYSVPGIVLVT